MTTRAETRVSALHSTYGKQYSQTNTLSEPDSETEVGWNAGRMPLNFPAGLATA